MEAKEIMNPLESDDRRSSTDLQLPRDLAKVTERQGSFDELGNEDIVNVYSELLARVSGLENIYGFMLKHFGRNIEEINIIREQTREYKRREDERRQRAASEDSDASSGHRQPEASEDSDASSGFLPDLDERVGSLERVVTTLHGEVKSYIEGVKRVQRHTRHHDHTIRQCERLVLDAREEMFREMDTRAENFCEELKEIWQSEMTNERTAQWAKIVDAERAKEAAEKMAAETGEQFNDQNRQMSFLVGEISDLLIDINQHGLRSPTAIARRLQRLVDRY